MSFYFFYHLELIYLNSEQPIKRHEEEEKYCDVVNLLARPFEDLVDSGFGH